jgi:hypothetical protein
MLPGRYMRAECGAAAVGSWRAPTLRKTFSPYRRSLGAQHRTWERASGTLQRA